MNSNPKLITCIVQRGRADKVVDAAMAAGAQGATISFGRGTGVRERLGLMGLLIRPEKEIIYIVTQQEESEEVMAAVVKAARLKEIGIYHVDTTLLGACAETHDALTGVKGSFEGTINALKALKEEGISMAVKTPVMKGNAAEVEDIRIMVESMDINHIASPLIFTKDDGNTAPLCHRPDDGQLKDFFLLREVKSLTDCNAGYSCHFGRCTFAIKADGDVNPCVSVPFSLGNVKESSLKKIWQENNDLELIRKTGAEPLSECSDCDLAGWCFRCEGISFTEEGRLFARSDELCRMARIRKEASHGRSQEEKGKKEIQQTAGRAC